MKVFLQFKTYWD